MRVSFKINHNQLTQTWDDIKKRVHVMSRKNLIDKMKKCILYTSAFFMQKILSQLFNKSLSTRLKKMLIKCLKTKRSDSGQIVFSLQKWTQYKEILFLSPRRKMLYFHYFWKTQKIASFAHNIIYYMGFCISLNDKLVSRLFMYK